MGEYAAVPLYEARELFNLRNSVEEIEEDLEIAIKRYSIAENNLSQEFKCNEQLCAEACEMKRRLSMFEGAAKVLIGCYDQLYDEKRFYDKQFTDGEYDAAILKLREALKK